MRGICLFTIVQLLLVPATGRAIDSEPNGPVAWGTLRTGGIGFPDHSLIDAIGPESDPVAGPLPAAGFDAGRGLAPRAYPSVSAGRLRDLQRADWLFRQRAYPKSTLPAGAAVRAMKQIRQAQAARKSAAAPEAATDQWQSLGPAPVLGGQIVGASANPQVSGRIRDIAVDPANAATHWFIASEGGGIWETTNGGASWMPRTDSEATLGTSAVALAPSNPLVLYAGAANFYAVVVGLLKSTDGGASWQIMAPTVFPDQTFFHFTTIKVHPGDPDTVLVETSEVYHPGGVFKSTDGGVTFSNTLRGNGTALQVDPGNFNHQYAAIRNNFTGFDNSYNGVYRSTDGGNTWQPISGPWNIVAEGGDVKVALAPSDANVIYVSVPGQSTWRTTNAWAAVPAWTALPADPVANHSFEVTIVDPADPAIFYGGAGGADFYRFQNNAWTSIIDSTHVDQHAAAFAGSLFLLGNDGGFWTSTDRGATWINRNSNLATVQFYAGSLHPTNASAALGGSQDNGTELWNGTSLWPWVWAGDGGYSAFSLTDPNTTWLVSATNLDVYRGVNQGVGINCCSGISNAGTGIDRSGAGFIAPIRRSPGSNVVIAGSDNLWKSTDFFDPGTPTWSSNGPEMGAEIGAIGFAPSDSSSQTYAFGTGNGQVRLTADGGTTWRNLDPGGALPNRYVRALAFHPTDANTLYLAYQGYDDNTPGRPGHIFKTTSALAATPAWMNVSPPVNIPMDALAIDPAAPGVVYAGSELGLWRTLDGGGSWSFMGPSSGMPNVPVLDLAFSPASGRLFAFTYGRGAYELIPAPKGPLTVLTNGTGSGSIHIAPGGTNCTGTCTVMFPSFTNVSITATPGANSIFAGWLGACTGLGSCNLFVGGPISVAATFAPGGTPLRVDVDGNGAYDALTDGLIILRYLFGLTGPPLTSGAIGGGATLTDPVQVLGRLDDIRPIFDVDGDGQVDALTDGLILIRYLFGLRGAALTVGAVGPGATRNTAALIESYLSSLTP
jgi:hypothetical protein